MPVYNDAPFVGAAIEAILAQDHADFELIISDNGSTDGSADICESFARQDRRVRLYRQSRNQGAVWNFRYVFDQGRGEYFAWAGGHDVMQPGFVSACANVLDQNPEVVLAYPTVRCIDPDGTPISGGRLDLIDTRANALSQRVRRTILELYSCHMLYGLFRREALASCRHGITCRGPDHVLLMEVSLRGAFAHVCGDLLHLRENRGPAARESSYADFMRSQLVRLDPHAFKGGALRPHWRWGWEHVKGLWAADIPAVKKVLLMPVVLGAFYQRWRPHLSEELLHPLREN